MTTSQSSRAKPSRRPTPPSKACTGPKRSIRRRCAFDDSCLAVPQEFAPDEIKALREKSHVSEPVFARYLNTSVSTAEVGDWPQAAERDGAEIAGRGAKAWPEGAAVGAVRASLPDMIVPRQVGRISAICVVTSAAMNHHADDDCRNRSTRSRHAARRKPLTMLPLPPARQGHAPGGCPPRRNGRAHGGRRVASRA